RIRARREKLGLKQQDIASALHISPQAVSKWERGENAPDVALFRPLARLLGVSTDWLLSVNEERADEFEATVFASSIHGAYEKSLYMTPRDFATWANGLFYQLTELTKRQDGVPVKYLGDQYLCFFSGVGHRARALETAVAARDVVGDKLRVGLATGRIYLGSVGHPDYARPDIMGEVVNIAFLTLGWAEANAKSGIAATEPVLEGASMDAVKGADEKAVFRGIDRPVHVFEVGANKPGKRRPGNSQARFDG
ncbi:MAG TPA: helix-turn-helix domain-containing protein, partial [Candidatus Hydrogenedentes bacterium]|nr:helix-turn-helix domain-containing protein [Candidatus Hydrogenedentota bacterium]